MPTSVHRARARSSRRLIAALAASLLAVTLVHAAPSAANAADGELLPNPDFSQGADGWRTNGPGQQLTILPSGIAQLTTSATQNATLNDRTNVVQNTELGSTYVVSARVRTTTPSVKGALRIREVSSGQASVSQSSFTLAGQGWKDVSLEVTTVRAGSHLDLNLVAWNLPKGKNLQIESVSVRPADPTSTPAPTTPPTTPPSPTPPSEPTPTNCDAAPPAGTLIGTTVYPIGQSLADSVNHIDSTFGPVKVVRHFSSGLPFGWSSRNAELLEGRTLVLSFKVPPTEITSGKHDAFFRNWFETAPTDQTIYWSYFHEPENNISAGEFTTAQYRAAWTRLAKIADKACKPNMHSTLILTEWTMNPGSKRDYRVYDAGSEYVDVLAFDPYNAMWDLERTTYDAPATLLGHIVSKMEADGRPWGIAEMGSRLMKGDTSGTNRAAWLRAIGDYTTKNDALFVAYFHGVGINGDFTLRDQASIKAWGALVKN